MSNGHNFYTKLQAQNFGRPPIKSTLYTSTPQTILMGNCSGKLASPQELPQSHRQFYEISCQTEAPPISRDFPCQVNLPREVLSGEGDTPPSYRQLQQELLCLLADPEHSASLLPTVSHTAALLLWNSIAGPDQVEDVECHERVSSSSLPLAVSEENSEIAPSNVNPCTADGDALSPMPQKPDVSSRQPPKTQNVKQSQAAAHARPPSSQQKLQASKDSNNANSVGQRPRQNVQPEPEPSPAPTPSNPAPAQRPNQFYEISTGRVITAPLTTSSHPYEYTFFVDKREEALKGLFAATDRRVLCLARRSKCLIYLALREAKDEPIFYRGMQSTPVTLVAPNLNALRQCLRLLDRNYPQFQAMSFYYENEAQNFGFVDHHLPEDQVLMLNEMVRGIHA